MSPQMQYRLIHRDSSGVTTQETPWIDVPDPEWTAGHTFHYEKHPTVYPHDHSPANFALVKNVPATDIEWRVQP